MASQFKVCIVDDSMREAQRYKSMLESQEQFAVNTICSYAQWEEVLAEGIEPETVLCIDETLTGWPRPDGIVLGSEFKRKHKYNPVIVYSSLANNLIKTYQEGIQYYLPRELLQDREGFPVILANCIARAAETLQLDTQQQLIEKLPQEFMLVNEDYRIVLVNAKKREVRGSELIGKLCYQVFHKKGTPCSGCSVQKVINRQVEDDHSEKWFTEPVYYEKAQDMVQDRYMIISAYPVETAHKRYIAEIVDDCTDTRVIDELTRAITDAREYEEIVIPLFRYMKCLGYTRARFYILTNDERDIAFSWHTENLNFNVTAAEFKDIGRQAIKIWEEQNKPILSGKWPFEDFANIDGIKKLEIREGSPIIYALLIQNHLSPARKILGALVGNREKNAWSISDNDKKTIEMISILLSNKIEAIRAAKLKALESRQTTHYFQILRALLKELHIVDEPEKIIATMRASCDKIIENSVLGYYSYDDFTKELSCQEKEHSITFSTEQESGAFMDAIKRAFEEQMIIIDKNSYAIIHPEQQLNLTPPFLPDKGAVAAEHAFLAMPFTAKALNDIKKFGVLLAYKKDQILYSEMEIEMIHTIVNACAIDYYNALSVFKMEEVVTQWKSLGLLHKYAHHGKSKRDLIMYCLTFITAGKGLGFNRALFFEYMPDKQCYLFKQAIGSIKKQEFDKIRTDLKNRRWDFETLLEKAPDIADEEFNRRMAGLIIDKQSPSLWEYLQKEEPEIVDLFLHPDQRKEPVIGELKTRGDLVYYIVVRIPGEHTPLGCLIADRRFAMHSFTFKDPQILQTFATEMQRILEIFDYKVKMMQSQQASTLGWMTSALGHELNQPALALHVNTDLLIDCLDNGQYKEARERALEIIEMRKRISNTIIAIKGFVDINKVEVIAPAKIIEQSSLLFKQKLRDHRITCNIKIEPGIPEIKVHSASLQYALTNLMKNAYDEYENREKKITDPLLEIHCYQEGGNVVFQVKDNAGGMTPEVLEQVSKAGSMFSTKPQKGWGYGLTLGILEKIIEFLSNIYLEDGRAVDRIFLDEGPKMIHGKKMLLLTVIGTRKDLNKLFLILKEKLDAEKKAIDEARKNKVAEEEFMSSFIRITRPAEMDFRERDSNEPLDSYPKK